MAGESYTPGEKVRLAFYAVGIGLGIYFIVRGKGADEPKPYRPPYYPKRLNGLKRRRRRR